MRTTISCSLWTLSLFHPFPSLSLLTVSILSRSCEEVFCMNMNTRWWDWRLVWVKVRRAAGEETGTKHCNQLIPGRHGSQDTTCPRSSDPFHIVTYYIKWVTTSWTHRTAKVVYTIGDSIISISFIVVITNTPRDLDIFEIIFFNALKALFLCRNKTCMKDINWTEVTQEYRIIMKITVAGWASCIYIAFTTVPYSTWYRRCGCSLPAPQSWPSSRSWCDTAGSPTSATKKKWL